jgi:GAF domain-containing protein
LVISISAVLYCLNLYRARAEQNRLRELASLNRELDAAKSQLTLRVDERTLELSRRTEELAARTRDLESVNERLERRARQFEAISEVSRSIISIRELQRLLPQINTVISRQFGFYHVGIFLLDEAGEYAVLSAANSEGGQRMLARKHRLRVGEEGIVGYVTATGRPRIALDVGNDAIFFNNPDLPGTHSEMALPLKSSGRIVGALDVQSTEIGAFSDEDIQSLSLLADQVGLAMENALLFEATQRSLAEAEAFSHQYLREGWNRLGREQQLMGYRYDIAGATPLSQPASLAGRKNGATDATEASQVDFPIELRGEVIGNLVIRAPAGKKWTSDELDLIKAVADRVALSAENARLFEETNRRAERERMVSEITSRIRSSNDPNEMIRTAAQELKNALGVSRVEVVPQRASRGIGDEDA